MDITNFRSQMNRDGARPNLFRVEVNLPTVLQNLNSGNSFGTKLAFTARAAQLPGSMIGKATAQYMGREVYFAGNRTFADWTITVMNDEDFIVRKTIEAWSAAINSHITNVRRGDLAGPNDYVADCSVHQLSKLGEDTILASYKMINAWPIDVSTIDLDWGTNDVIEEFSITFSMDTWTSAHPETGGGVFS